MPTNFELERLKPKVDIFKIPENRVHELTDSNVSLIVSTSDRKHERSYARAIVSTSDRKHERSYS